MLTPTYQIGRRGGQRSGISILNASDGKWGSRPRVNLVPQLNGRSWLGVLAFIDRNSGDFHHTSNITPNTPIPYPNNKNLGLGDLEGLKEPFLTDFQALARTRNCTTLGVRHAILKKSSFGQIPHLFIPSSKMSSPNGHSTRHVERTF